MSTTTPVSPVPGRTMGPADLPKGSLGRRPCRRSCPLSRPVSLANPLARQVADLRVKSAANGLVGRRSLSSRSFSLACHELMSVPRQLSRYRNRWGTKKGLRTGPAGRTPQCPGRRRPDRNHPGHQPHRPGRTLPARTHRQRPPQRAHVERHRPGPRHQPRRRQAALRPGLPSRRQPYCPVPRKSARCQLVRPACRLCQQTRPVPLIDRKGNACAAEGTSGRLSLREGRGAAAAPPAWGRSELSAAPAQPVWCPITTAGQVKPGARCCGTATLPEQATGSSPAATTGA